MIEPDVIERMNIVCRVLGMKRFPLRMTAREQQRFAETIGLHSLPFDFILFGDFEDLVLAACGLKEVPVMDDTEAAGPADRECLDFFTRAVLGGLITSDEALSSLMRVAEAPETVVH